MRLGVVALAALCACRGERAEPARDAGVFAEPAPLVVDAEVKFADLGTCALESGERVQACRLGYRTFGTLAPDKSNVVLWPTWFTGRSADLVPLVPDRFVDTRRFYLVLVESLGSGVSSSPSNAAPDQRRLRFPLFTVRDMVRSQHRLLTEHLGVEHLHAVAGISMGGMQAIEWSVSFPSFVSKVAALVGSPQLTAQDLLLWRTMLSALDSDKDFRAGDYEGHPPLRTAVDLLNLVLVTPEYRVAHTSPAELPAFLRSAEAGFFFDWNDMHRQLEAMLRHDVAAPYGSLEAAAARVTARSLYVVSARDQVVNPQPAQRFGALVGAEVRVSDSPCGHLAVQLCETDAVAAMVSAFLTH